MTLSPVSLTIDEFSAMLNLELADHPIYDGLELQWFDDDEHGTGMLAFLSRRGDRSMDYYCAPGLRLNRETYDLGGGTRSWNETRFDTARLVVTTGGVDAEARFTDVDGRTIEVRVDDRGEGHYRTGALLAPIGAGVDHPTQLLLVWMPRFDLVRVAGSPPTVRIDGEEARIGRLPGRWLHRRHLVKYAAPLITASVGRSHHGPLSALPDTCRLSPTGRMTARSPHHETSLTFTPPWPDVTAMTEGDALNGTWIAEVDDAVLTGGTWSAARHGDEVVVSLDVTRRWRPVGLPLLMRVVTTVVPVFRRWPTTYRWRGKVTLGEDPVLTSEWERTT
jgi:hypothetical protein